MTPLAQELVIDRLTSHEFNPKYRAEVLRIVQFIKNGEGSDGQ
jgi:predicted neutral ceramidase superfamily lipid hydrolase